MLNVVQGLGPEAGQPLVEDPRVAVVSFTGSTGGRADDRARRPGERLAKVCLELGGKNPLVVCDDADLEAAADAAALSAYSNAGQRCAAGSRHHRLRRASTTSSSGGCWSAPPRRSVGPADDDDLGPVINERQLEHMLAAVARRARPGRDDPRRRRAAARRRRGFFMAPTLIEGTDELSAHGAVRADHDAAPRRGLRRGDRARQRLAVRADRGDPDGVACTAAQEFLARIASGVASVNGPTYGTEPHMPFGGLRHSGTGWREAGTEALDVYSDLKTLYVNHDPSTRV